ncbi:MAG: hypothetical protein JOZ15_20560 [Acidobacteria bacterium]|nr:hypothetical protein [Acidobacteriota bacterium]
MIDEKVKEDLDELIPAGERSRFASEALRTQLALVRRRRAVEEVERLRRAGPHVATSEILAALRSIRDAR